MEQRLIVLQQWFTEVKAACAESKAPAMSRELSKTQRFAEASLAALDDLKASLARPGNEKWAQMQLAELEAAAQLLESQVAGVAR